MKNNIIADERIAELSVHDNFLTFHLADGRILSVPTLWFPRIANASDEDRKHFEILSEGFAVHWPRLDEDLEISGLLAGNAAPSVRARISVSPDEISAYRERVGISQSDLAIQLGVRQATVSDWEKGKTNPSPLAKSKLADLIRKSQVVQTPLPEKRLADLHRVSKLVVQRALKAALKGTAKYWKSPVSSGAFVDLTPSQGDQKYQVFVQIAPVGSARTRESRQAGVPIQPAKQHRHAAAKLTPA